MTKVLAIDFGTQRVGLAISRGTLAEPLTVVPNDEHLFEQLQAIVKNEQIEQVVIGLSEGEMADQTREFAQELEEIVAPTPIDFADETLSSHEVQEKLKEKGVKKSVRIGAIDHFAAALILEQWLELQAN